MEANQVAVFGGVTLERLTTRFLPALRHRVEPTYGTRHRYQSVWLGYAKPDLLLDPESLGSPLIGKLDWDLAPALTCRELYQQQKGVPSALFPKA